MPSPDFVPIFNHVASHKTCLSILNFGNFCRKLRFQQHKTPVACIGVANATHGAVKLYYTMFLSIRQDDGLLIVCLYS